VGEFELVIIGSSAITPDGSPTLQLHQDLIDFLSQLNRTKGLMRHWIVLFFLPAREKEKAFI
jgi:hypothetical protein